jgi:hypothetical protein
MVTLPVGAYRDRTVRQMLSDSVNKDSTNTISNSDTTFPFITTTSSLDFKPAMCNSYKIHVKLLINILFHLNLITLSLFKEIHLKSFIREKQAKTVIIYPA